MSGKLRKSVKCVLASITVLALAIFCWLGPKLYWIESSAISVWIQVLLHICFIALMPLVLLAIKYHLSEKSCQVRRADSFLKVGIIVFLAVASGVFFRDISRMPESLKRLRTRALLRKVAIATLLYSDTYDTFPSSGEDIHKNPRRLEFVQWGSEGPWRDAWGNPITLTVTGTRSAHIATARSFGRDGTAGGTDFDEDLTAIFNEKLSQTALLP